MTDTTIETKQGASFLAHFQWCEPPPDPDEPETPGPPYDLTNFTARMQIRARAGLTRAGELYPLLAEATTEDESIILGIDPDDPDTLLTPDPTNGWIRILIPGEVMRGVNVLRARYDLELVDGSGFIYRVVEGPVTNTLNVTVEEVS